MKSNKLSGWKLFESLSIAFVGVNVKTSRNIVAGAMNACTKCIVSRLNGGIVYQMRERVDWLEGSLSKTLAFLIEPFGRPTNG